MKLERDNNSSVSGSRKRRKKPFNYKKYLLLFIVVLSIGGLVALGMDYKASKRAQQNNVASQNSAASVKSPNKGSNVTESSAAEKKEKYIIGQKADAKKLVGVDSEKVWNSLNTYDFTNDGKKEVFLTFDDGPSLTNTPEILRILKKNDVKATFFVIGKSLKIDGADKILKQEYEDGMAIANHTYSHDYNYLYPNRVLNLKNFVSDINKNEDLIRKSLGMPNFKTRVVRCPGGQISWKKTEPLSDYLITNNMASMDWNALNGDAEGKKKDAEGLYNEAVASSKGKNLVVLLMHDTYGKEETVKALDKIIKFYKSAGYQFKTMY